VNLIGKIINNRYHIVKQLGEGGMSQVFEAHDQQKNLNVAIKLMKKNLTSTFIDDLIRFRREIEVISTLNHPNIIEVYGQYEYEAAPFIVMELLAGNNLSKLLKKRAGFSTGEIIGVITQLAEALNYVHNRGIIHRDLKPSNIFINDWGQLKLLDFGVALVMELSAIREEKMVAGTFGYMSPEATGILDKRIDERSDLYSLGVIFYHLLTGEPPFKGTELNQLLHQQVALIPTRPGKSKTNIPGILDEIVLKLLHKDPDLRYQSAKGLLADLDRFRQGETEFEVGATDQKLKLTYQTRLVGREAEIKKVERRFDEAMKEKGSLCLITGEAGIGKSRLVEEIKGYVYEKNGLFIRGRCLNYENKFPYQPFKDAIDEFVNKLMYLNKDIVAQKIARIKNSISDLSGIVANLNPRIEKLFGEMKKLVPLEPERENQRSLLVLSDFFCSLADQNQACVLFLDDLQWADESSLNLLIEILGKVSNSNLLVLGTYRNDEIRPGHKIELIKALVVEKNYHFEDIILKPLDYSHITCLIKNILGTNKGNKELSDYILKKSNGNPFFAINIIRELVETKVIQWDEGIWKEDIQRLNEIPVSNSLIDIILRRIKNLSKEQQELLRKAAVIGREFEIDLLYRLTTLNKTKVVNMIDDFIALQLLEHSMEHGRVLFVHDRIRDAFYHTLTEKNKRKIHLQIALAIESMNQDHLDKFTYELAYHYVESGDQENALKYVIPAATKAQQSYANEEAIRFYQIGIELLEQKNEKTNPKWLSANEELAKIYLTIGKNDEAILIANHLLNSIVDRNVKARLFKTIGIAYFKKGDWVNCEENLLYALNLLDEKVPKNFIIILFCIKEYLIYVLNDIFAKYGPHKKKELEIIEKKKEIIWIYITLSWMYILSNVKKFLYTTIRIMNISKSNIACTKEAAISIVAYASICMVIPFSKKAVKYHNKSLNLRKNLKDEWGEAQSLQLLGFTYAWSNNHNESISKFEQSMNLFKKVGDLWELGMVLNGLSFEYYYIADYIKSLNYLNQYLQLSRKINDINGTYTALTNITQNHIELGDLFLAEKELSQLLISCKNNPSLECRALIKMGILYMEKLKFLKSITYFKKARDIDRNNNLLKIYTTEVYPCLAEANLLKLERKIVRHRKVTKLEIKKANKLCNQALRLTKPWMYYYGKSLFVKAKYYALFNKTNKAKKIFIKSIEYNKKNNRSFEVAKSNYELGLFLLKSNNDNAILYLNLAYKIFRDINAQLYCQKCRELLGIHNEEPNEPLNELTAQERLKSDRRIEAVLMNSRDISSILDIDELLKKILDNAIELVGAERGLLLLYPETGEKKLQLKVLRNIQPEEFEKGLIASFSIISKIEKEQKPIIINDAVSEEDFKMQSSVVLHGIRSVLGVPIMLRGEILGILYLNNNLVSGLFQEDDLKVIDLLLNQAGISIENARLYNRLTALNQNLEIRVQKRTIQLENLNQELTDKNEQLKQHAATIEELAVVKERNRMASEVHDTLGHTMTSIKSLLDLSLVELNNGSFNEAKTVINDARKFTKEGMGELRRSILGLSSSGLESNSIIDAIKSLIIKFESLGIHIDFSVDEPETYRDKNINFSAAIYRLCQEALTNSVRHGKAKNISIIVRTINETVRISIIDDGCGCKNIHKGFGLSGMEQRVKNLNGKILLVSDGEKGFNIHVEIPVKEAT
jgi:signal transduction histidine kinase/tetratricopeptide (TPR) repeat protein/tRNA A-37 threonylcarbamoyl transferase component Bud32